MLSTPPDELPIIYNPVATKKQHIKASIHDAKAAYPLFGKVYYWDYGLNSFAVSWRKAKKFLNQFELLGALILFVGSLILFGVLWFSQGSFGTNNLFSSLFVDPTPLAALFWLAWICFGFIIYKMVLVRKPADTIFYNKVENDKNSLYKDWSEVSSLPRHSIQSLSKVCHPNLLLVMEDSFIAAKKSGMDAIVSWHIFYALLSQSQIKGFLVRLGIPAKSLQTKIGKLFVGQGTVQEPQISDECFQILFRSLSLAASFRQDRILLTDLLVATVKQSEKIQELLYDLEVDEQKLENAVAWLRIEDQLKERRIKLRRAAAHRSKHGIDKAMTAVATPFLNKFSQDLTIAAKFGYLEPCVAREKEIHEVFRVIEGGRQSIVLVGDHGVGKTAIVEGIAQLMVEERVPKRIEDKRLVELSLSALFAGTTVNGALERLQRIMHEVAKAKNIILYIDHIEDLVGQGGEGEGVDVAGALAKYLSNSAFLTISSATTNGYKKHVSNTQLGSVLSKVQVNIMDENQAIKVLESKVAYAEYKHNVFFSYDALAAAVDLAEHFIQDQVLPASALAIMSEAASYTKTKKGANSLVLKDDVAAIISDKTGVPVTSITEDESQKLLRLEDALHERVVGQDEAVDIVANALRRARADIRAGGRPISTFLFLGPTGVGKTELAKTIADVYFGGENKMIRMDMSEFQDTTSVYRLIGQPGVKGTGLLTEAVRQQPFSLVLLDELEKADPNVLNVFLQVFDDGRLTDSVGRVVDFTNTIIIATSNAGTAYVQEQIKNGVDMDTIRQALIQGELQQSYRPEFLNRFDGIVLFKSLEKAEIKKIAGLMLKRVAKDLETRGVGLRIEDVALEALAEVGFDPTFGARPMRRAIQDHIENALAELVLQKKLKRRDTVVIGQNMKITVESP